ncbi:MAG TPA: ergothioneine biosynthesis protein EgtC [Acidimicrobiia bacterium]|jgi:gamma-glutamyl hercynylcysteine S-oxide hydrolase|nr:ergothioneine biosynthesis protein EgtC [Acidimicrobiia bacterium]
MCRHLAYVGPSVTLEKLIIKPEHSLLQQSFAPRYQTHGTINADGFGVGWYDRDKRVEPARYRTTRQIWADVSFASIAGLVSSNAVLAAVRSASPGMPIEETSTPPFTEGPWLFSHNGFVPGFRTGVGRELRHKVSEARALGIGGATDSELLFALVLDRLDAGTPPADALVSVIGLVEELTTARLNLLLTDGERIAATACRNSLFVFDDRQLTGAVVVASEPYDDEAGWEAVKDGSVVELGDDKLEVRPF